MNDRFVRRDRAGIAYYSCVALQQIGFSCHGFSTRHGGVSALPHASLNLTHVDWDAPENVTENRRRFLAALGAGSARLATLSQIHSDRLHILDENGAPENGRPKADAIATGLRGVAIAVQVADCFPILIADPRKRAVAAVHAGWRGTLARILVKAVAGMCETFGTDPSDLVVAVGPGIRSCCFEVGPEVVDAFQVQYPGVRLARPNPAQQGKYLLDLPAALRIQFGEAELNRGNVFDLGMCTRCNTSEFFSYRGEGLRSGRMMATISLGS